MSTEVLQSSKYYGQQWMSWIFGWHDWPHTSKNVLKIHGVWKLKKKSHSTLRAKRATFTFLIKMPKIVNFGEFLKRRILRSNSVTRHVSFNKTKIDRKCQNSNETFWVIFNQCEIGKTKQKGGNYFLNL